MCHLCLKFILDFDIKIMKIKYQNKPGSDRQVAAMKQTFFVRYNTSLQFNNYMIERTSLQQLLLKFEFQRPGQRNSPAST